MRIKKPKSVPCAQDQDVCLDYSTTLRIRICFLTGHKAYGKDPHKNISKDNYAIKQFKSWAHSYLPL